MSNNFTPSTHIEITGVDLLTFVKGVYDLSQPVGMGFTQNYQDELSDADIERILSGEKGWGGCLFHMDYVNGRCCKMVVFRDEEDRLWINDVWFGHTAAQLDELLQRVDASRV